MTDEQIESAFQKCGGKWDGDRWVIEDADLHPFARTLLATPDAAEAGKDAWQPIETAPKDGTVVDMWSRLANRRFVNLVWLKGRERDSRCAPGGVWHHLEVEGWGELGETDGCGLLTESQFSHWMLPPARPAALPQSGAEEKTS